MRNLGRGALREIRQRQGFQPPALFSALFVFCQAHWGLSGEHVLDSVLVGRV